MRVSDTSRNVYLALITSKTKVAHIKRLSIPRLELCHAQVLAQLVSHVQKVLQLPLTDTFAWTDSTIVLSWLSENPCRYVANRVSLIIDKLPPEQWNHVAGVENPADCAFRCLFPMELLNHSLRWEGPTWLQLPPASWPNQPDCFTRGSKGDLSHHNGGSSAVHYPSHSLHNLCTTTARYHIDILIFQ